MDRNQLQTSIQTALQELLALAEGASIEELVRLGNILWGLDATIQGGLDPIKEKLREAGEEAAGYRPGKRRLEGGGDSALITVPQPKMVLRSGTDIDRLKERLRGDFHRLFKEKTTITPNQKELREEIETANPSRKALLLSVLDQKSAKTRVSFAN